ncbi:CU044_2847 family protein [Kitasatospora sp. NPDC057015]|uniref:CU044_2847 family protein n=1 Tax=Kitasatospora sp. NPDC057015 TaxID=3346001 RepID=UPI00362F2EFD
MGESIELKLADGTGVLVEVVAGHRAPDSGGGSDADLPAGTAPVVPVGRATRAVAATGQALADVLRPLGGVLDSVHSAVTAAVRPPDEVSVELGIKLTQDLKLGIASAGGEATITVRATWTPARTAAERLAGLGEDRPAGAAAPALPPAAHVPAATSRG